MKKIFLLAFMFSAGCLLSSSSSPENPVSVSGTLGDIKLSLAPNGSLENKIRNTSGETKAGCFSGYTGTLENQKQDTMVFIKFKSTVTKGTDCNKPMAIKDVIKAGTYNFEVSGKDTLGSAGSLTIKIKDKYYSTSLAAQPKGKFIKVTSITPYSGNGLYDPTNTYKTRYLVKGTASAKLFNAMVKDDFTETSDFKFSVIFAE